MNEIIPIQYLKLRHPFTCLVSGPTGSGKTVLVRRLLKNFESAIDIKVDNKLKIIWCYGQFQNLYKVQISEKIEIKYFDYLIGLSEISNYKPHVIVIDDMMTEMAKNSELSDLFSRGSHHLNISVIFIVQNIFHQGKEMRNISLNSQYIILLKSFRNRSQIKHLEYQVFGEKSKTFMEIYEDATSKPFGYLLIDLKSDTPDKFRFRTRMTEEELSDSLRKKTRFAPYYYLKK
jgi:GTPase SAR1 family protein